MTEPQIQPRTRDGKVVNEDRLSPVDRKLADLPPGKYYKLSEVMEILGVSNSLLRRLLKNPDIKAPSMEMPMGRAAPVYLYTQDDIAELREYIRPNTRVRKRK